eukprot:9492587-Pyramimonas_sp.AAC.2
MEYPTQQWFFYFARAVQLANQGLHHEDHGASGGSAHGTCEKPALTMCCKAGPLLCGRVGASATFK